MGAPDLRDDVEAPGAPTRSPGVWSDAEPFDPVNWLANRAHLDIVLDEAVRRSTAEQGSVLVATRREILQAVEAGFRRLCELPDIPIASRRQQYFEPVGATVSEAIRWYKGQTVN